MEIRLIIPMTLPSMNKFYSQRHWSYRKKLVDEWHDIVYKTCLISGLKKDPISEVVEIEITCYFKNKNFWIDADNLAGKLVIDGLRKYGVLYDDNPDYIAQVSYKSRLDRENPRTKITIRGKPS